MEPLKKPNKPTKTLGKKSLRTGRKTRREADFKRPSETEFKKEKMSDKVLYCQGIGSWLADLIKQWGSLIRQSCLLPRQKISGPPKKD